MSAGEGYHEVKKLVEQGLDPMFDERRKGWVVVLVTGMLKAKSANLAHVQERTCDMDNQQNDLILRLATKNDNVVTSCRGLVSRGGQPMVWAVCPPINLGTRGS